jgi:hypothetical protein
MTKVQLCIWCVVETELPMCCAAHDLGNLHMAGRKYASGRSCDRPSRYRFSSFSCLQENASDGSQVPSCHSILLIQLSRLKLIRIKPLCCQSNPSFFYKFYNSTFRKSKFRSPCLEPLSLTILTSSLSHCPYHKDKWVKPVNLLTKRCSFAVPKFLPWPSLSSYSFSSRFFSGHRSWESFSWSMNSGPFTEPEGSQQHDSSSNPQSDECSLHSDIQYFRWTGRWIMSRNTIIVFASGFKTEILHAPLILLEMIIRITFCEE